MARKLVVEIVGDSKNYERALQRSSKATKDFQASTTKLNVGLTGMFAGGAKFGAGFLGTQGVVEAMRQSVKVASNLNEQISKSEVVFGDSSQAIQEWARSASKFGVANDQALEATGTFGNLFRTVDLGTDTAADMSKRLVELAADLSAFNNVPVEEVLEALRSGLIGEAEPMRRFGVLLSENRVKQQAMAVTGKRNAKSLSEQEKALARFKIILEDTAPAHGNFAKTQGDLAQQTKTLQANLRDLQAELGGEVTPELNDAARSANYLLTNLQKLDKLSGGKLGKLFMGPFEFAKLGPERLVWQYKQIFGEAGDQAGVEFAKNFNFSAVDALTGGLQTAGLRAKDIIEGRGRGKPPPVPKGPGIELRRQWFDESIFRRLDRLQDLSLRNQLAGLRTIAQDIRARMAVTKDTTYRLRLEDQLVDVLRQQRDVQAQITDQVKAGNAALKDRAEAIKSAVLERLQRRQTDVLNRRALADAKEQLRIARMIGGPKGIQAASRDMQDVLFDMRMARFQAAPATLAGGRFALGNVITVNVNGAGDPDQVAGKVVEIIQRRGKHTTKTRRGTRTASP